MSGSADPGFIPGYWMHETTGRLRPAVEAYLLMAPMSEEHISAMRAYLRQWMRGYWEGADVEQLRRDVDGLTSRKAIHDWLGRALISGIDPL